MAKLNLRRSTRQGSRAEALAKIEGLTRRCHELEGALVSAVTVDERLREMSRRIAVIEGRLDLSRAG